MHGRRIATAKSESDQKYWAIWFPVTTVIAVINSLFWSSLIYYAIGYKSKPERPYEEELIKHF